MPWFWLALIGIEHWSKMSCVVHRLMQWPFFWRALEEPGQVFGIQALKWTNIQISNRTGFRIQISFTLFLRVGFRIQIWILERWQGFNIQIWSSRALFGEECIVWLLSTKKRPKSRGIAILFGDNFFLGLFHLKSSGGRSGVHTCTYYYMY